MKLIIQIPCYNEEASLPVTLSGLPTTVVGFDKVEWLVINDGSTDDTEKVARQFGVHHVVNFSLHKGLAKAFVFGLDRCLLENADVIVNIDADNQYRGEDIHKLTQPILDKNADYVIGERPISQIRHFPLRKKLLQRVGSWIVRLVSGVSVTDAPSGFRAMSRECALRLNVFNSYTYTLETLIQAGQSNIEVLSVPIGVNPDLRPSRLVKGTFNYVKRSINTLVRIFVVYQPFKFFFSIGLILFLTGIALGIRYLYYFFLGDGTGHMQSVVLASIFIGIGFQTILVGFVADLIAVNRKLLEDVISISRREKLKDNNNS